MTSDVSLDQKRVQAKRLLAKQRLRGGSATAQAFSTVGTAIRDDRLDNRLSEQARIEQQLGAPFNRTGELGSFTQRMGLALPGS